MGTTHARIVEMSDQEFDYIRHFLQDRCALVLDSGKRYLVESRLTPLLPGLNLHSLSDLVGQLQIRDNQTLHTTVVEAMLTSETLFFRDHVPFETLRKTVLPELIQKRRAERRLNIWSAACATGQEPYSVAIILKEHFGHLKDWDISILATDVSRDVLQRAREGVYDQVEINRGLPATLLLKYFEQHGMTWRLSEGVRNMVKFQELNLARPWPRLPRMDIILLRNVMIYFEPDTKIDILDRVADLLVPDGYLLLGTAETTINLVDRFRRVERLKTGFYQRVS
jgi:chemotaxis protein methyltransferase CheR